MIFNVLRPFKPRDAEEVFHSSKRASVEIHICCIHVQFSHVAIENGIVIMVIPCAGDEIRSWPG